MLLQENY